MKRRILLVEGPEGGLEKLEAALAARPARWEVALARGDTEALGYLAQSPPDAVVTDIRLGGMTGLQLAEQAAARAPRAHRIILADLSDLETLLRCVGNVHQFLSKPCDPGRLILTLERAFAFGVWLPIQTVQPLVGRLPRLPSPFAQYSALVRELQQESPDLDGVADLIAQDPPMAAKTLQLVNSAASGPPLDEADPVAAVLALGLPTTRSLMLLSHSYSDFRETPEPHFSAAGLWRHSVQVSRWARAIAESEGAPGSIQIQASTAGLLHDLGKLALAANLPRQFQQASENAGARRARIWEAEHRIFGADHGEVGAWLLALWNLPVPIVEAVAMHHHPIRFLSDGFSPLAAVHVADAFGHATTLEAAIERIDLDYLGELGLKSRLARWWQTCETSDSSRATSSPLPAAQGVTSPPPSDRALSRTPST